MRTLIRGILIMLLASFTMNMYSQSQEVENDMFEKAVEAYVELRNAVEAKDTVGIRHSAKKINETEIVDFSELHVDSESMVSMNGHLVFDGDFANKLVEGENVYSQSEYFVDAHLHRAPNVGSSNKVEAKNYCVKKGKWAKLSFVAKGKIKIAVVSEAGGRLTMNIFSYDKERKQTGKYYDTDDVKRGRSYRKAVLELPSDKSNSVILKVKNCTRRDMSFVVIKQKVL